MISLSEGYCALLIAILRNCTVNTAIRSLRTGKLRFSIEDYREMCRMKRLGSTYAQVGRAFGISKDVAHKDIRKYKDAEKAAGYEW